MPHCAADIPTLHPHPPDLHIGQHANGRSQPPNSPCLPSRPTPPPTMRPSRRRRPCPSWHGCVCGCLVPAPAPDLATSCITTSPSFPSTSIPTWAAPQSPMDGAISKSGWRRPRVMGKTCKANGEDVALARETVAVDAGRYSWDCGYCNYIDADETTKRQETTLRIYTLHHGDTCYLC